MRSDGFGKLKFALQELGEASQSLRNEFAIAGSNPNSPSSSPSRRSTVAQQNAVCGLPNLVDEYRYARKLDYTDRPQAAKHSNPFHLGDNCEAAPPASGRGMCRLSPTSTRATELPGDGASSIDDSASTASLPRSTWSSPERSRPSTQRPSTQSPSRPSTQRSPQRSRSQGPVNTTLSGCDDIQVVDIVDTDSEESGGSPIPGGLTLSGLFSQARALEGSLSLDSTRSTSRRLFRRTLNSYFVSEEGAPPTKSSPAGSLPHSLRNMHGPQHGLSSIEAPAASGSDNLDLELVEVTDLEV